MGHRFQRTSQGSFGERLNTDPLFPSQPRSPRLREWKVPRGRHILSCDLLLHLGMARCHVPSSWQTAVKESSTWFPCLSRGRGAISTRRHYSSLPALSHTVGSAKTALKLSDFSTPADVTLSSFSLDSPLRPELHMGALSHTAESQRKG